MSPKSVTRYTQALRDMGLLTIESRALENGARTSNGFRLPIAARQLLLLPHGQIVPTPGQPVHTPGSSSVHTPGTELCPYPLVTCVQAIEPSREPSTEPSGKKAAPKAPFVLPEWVPSGPWEAFKATRKAIRAPLTDYASNLIVRELSRLRDAGHDPGAVLDQSVRLSWRGVFPIKNEREGIAEHNRRVAEEAKRERAARESA